MPAKFKKNEIVHHLIPADNLPRGYFEFPRLFSGKVKEIRQQTNFARCVKDYVYTVEHDSKARINYEEWELLTGQEVTEELERIIKQEVK